MTNKTQDFRLLSADLARLIALEGELPKALALLEERLPALLDKECFLLVRHGAAPGKEAQPGLHLALRLGPMGAAGPQTPWRSLFQLKEPREVSLEGEQAPSWAESLRSAGHTRALAVPLFHDGAVLGAMLLAGPGELREDLCEFVRETATLLGAAESRAAQSIGESAARRMLEDELQRILTIHEISTSLASSLVMEEIFVSTVKKLTGLLPIDRAVLALLEKGDETVRLISLDLREGDDPEIHENVPVANTISGRIMGRNAPYLVRDLGQVDHPSHLEERLAGLGLISYIALPLTMRDRPLGSFHLGSQDPDAYQEEDLNMLTQVAQQFARSLEHARVFQEAQARMQELSALYEVGKTLLQTLDLQDLLDEVLKIVGDTFHFEHCAILLLDARSGELRIQAQRGYAEEAVESFRAKIDDFGITATAARTGKPVYVPDVEEDPRYVPGISRGRSELSLPLVIGSEVLGVLDIESPKRGAFSGAEIHALNLFATQVALALDKARLFQRVHDQAITDGLTGLLNQRAFHDRLKREADRSRRTGDPFSLVLIDMDNLKEINDDKGHMAGNQAICAVADAIRDQSRGMDHTARFGGDEFALILPEADRKQATGAAERFRKTLGEIELESIGPVSVSCGVATFPSDADDESRLIVLADRAMYEAKRRGRNQVVSVSELAVSEGSQ